ncbi:MAG: hypothetical protein H0W20_02805, partial [Chthoniobacterales bacterium]|nr:hypothetical protein [Chthoniobacterales bacterium]
MIRPSPPKPGGSQKIHPEDKVDDTGGFRSVKKLQGNIGYIDLRGFLPPRVAGEKAASAMNSLADTDALIFDLRKNGGGSGDMVALLISYLVDETPVHGLAGSAGGEDRGSPSNGDGLAIRSWVVAIANQCSSSDPSPLAVRRFLAGCV